MVVVNTKSFTGPSENVKGRVYGPCYTFGYTFYSQKPKDLQVGNFSTFEIREKNYTIMVELKKMYYNNISTFRQSYLTFLTSKHREFFP